VTLTDQYNRSIAIKLWNEHATDNRILQGVSIKADRLEVDEWQNIKSLNSTAHTNIQVSDFNC